LLDIDQKIILDHQNNFAGPLITLKIILKIMSNAAKNFDVPATGLSVLPIF